MLTYQSSINRKPEIGFIIYICDKPVYKIFHIFLRFSYHNKNCFYLSTIPSGTIPSACNCYGDKYIVAFRLKNPEITTYFSKNNWDNGCIVYAKSNSSRLKFLE